MTEYEFYGYSPDALAYNPDQNSFTLGAEYNSDQNRRLFKVADDDGFFDGDAIEDELGDDKTQKAVVSDGNNVQIASGAIYVEQVGLIEAPDGSLIELHRIEVGGELMGYVPSDRLDPGSTYPLVSAYQVGEAVDGSDTRATHQFYRQNGVPCFGPGTMITTQEGEIPVEWLETGDRVLTRDHGFQPILWIGRSKIPQRYFDEFPEERPVRIPAGSLGLNSPTHDLHLTGDHRIMLRSAMAELLFFSSEVFAPAKAWTDVGLAAKVRPQRSYTLTHILCASHEVIMAEGAWVESMFTGSETLRRLAEKDVDRLRELLGSELHQSQTARPCLTRKEAVMLLSEERQSARMVDEREHSRRA